MSRIILSLVAILALSSCQETTNPQDILKYEEQERELEALEEKLKELRAKLASTKNDPPKIPVADLQKQLEEEVAITKLAEGLAGGKDEGRKTAILQKMKDMQAEIFEREDVIRIKIGEIKGWKSKASQWEANAFKENNQARRKKAIGYSEVYRDKAQELADENSNSYIELARLNNELEDLKRLGIR
ncbi:MAG: hypothetical protein OSB05_01145 [Akkermansiaceae bacterium]|nr:hypothetical protein [Akkermansiaceae bacterium]